MSLKLDEIGYWSEMKLEFIQKYANAYSLLLAKYPELSHVYIDAFAGAGRHVSKTTGRSISGSPEIALNVKPPFNEYFFIDTDRAKVAELKRLSERYPNVHIYESDCNATLLSDVFPNVQYDDFRRGLCFLDPYGLHLDWDVIREAGRMKSIDIVLNFPSMDMFRNVLRHKLETVTPSNMQRMTRFWGDESWKEIAYHVDRDMFGREVGRRRRRLSMEVVFQKRLREVAGFGFVPDPLPMFNTAKALVYYLFFASNNKTANKIATDIFKKYRTKGMHHGSLFSDRVD